MGYDELAIDSLTTARTTHRITVLTAVAVALFGWSARPPADLEACQDELLQLSNVDWELYTSMVTERAKTAYGEAAIAIDSLVREVLADRSPRVSLASEWTSQVEQPPHVGMLNIDVLAVSDRAKVSAAEIDRLLSYDFARRDAVLVIPQLDELEASLLDWIRQHVDTGLGSPSWTLTNWRLDYQPIDFGTAIDSFPPSDDVTLYATAELRQSLGAAPIFQHRLGGKVLSMAETSLRGWALAPERLGTHARTLGDRVETTPNLRRAWPEMVYAPIPEALAAVSQRIRTESTDVRDVDLLGLKVPGGIMSITGPLLVLGLAVSLRSELKHITRTVPRGSLLLDRFSWSLLGRASTAQLILTVALPTTVGWFGLLRATSFETSPQIVIGGLLTVCAMIATFATAETVRELRGDSHSGTSKSPEIDAGDERTAQGEYVDVQKSRSADLKKD